MLFLDVYAYKNNIHEFAMFAHIEHDVCKMDRNEKGFKVLLEKVTKL